MTLAAVELYGAALTDPLGPWALRDQHGTSRPLSIARWVDPTCAADEALLDRVKGPVLDVGCGPGRMVVALLERGVVALGVDVAETAVRMARLRGAMVLRRSIFDAVPGHGRWSAALLVDGNLGIGGDPAGLLRRLGDVLKRGGHIFAEVEPPGAPTRDLQVRLEGSAALSGWFPWAEVGVDGVPALAADAGLDLIEMWQDGERWFVQLRSG